MRVQLRSPKDTWFDNETATIFISKKADEVLVLTRLNHWVVRTPCHDSYDWRTISYEMACGWLHQHWFDDPAIKTNSGEV